MDVSCLLVTGVWGDGAVSNRISNLTTDIKSSLESSPYVSSIDHHDGGSIDELRTLLTTPSDHELVVLNFSYDFRKHSRIRVRKSYRYSSIAMVAILPYSGTSSPDKFLRYNKLDFLLESSDEYMGLRRSDGTVVLDTDNNVDSVIKVLVLKSLGKKYIESNVLAKDRFPVVSTDHQSMIEELYNSVSTSGVSSLVMSTSNDTDPMIITSTGYRLVPSFFDTIGKGRRYSRMYYDCKNGIFRYSSDKPTSSCGTIATVLQVDTRYHIGATMMDESFTIDAIEVPVFPMNSQLLSSVIVQVLDSSSDDSVIIRSGSSLYLFCRDVKSLLQLVNDLPTKDHKSINEGKRVVFHSPDGYSTTEDNLNYLSSTYVYDENLILQVIGDCTGENINFLY